MFPNRIAQHLTLGSMLLAATAASMPANAADLPILPLPRSAAPAQGSFRLTAASGMAVPHGDAGARNAANRLGDLLLATRGFRPALASGGAIRFVRARGMAAESYRLDISGKGAVIRASDDAGLLYGAISLWQLATANGDGTVEAVRIDDAPRFAWRGLMLDSARHYQSPEFIMRLIDWMAAHKLNRFHWHLVDDQGWRLEIRKYPKLTEVGAWRTPASAPGAPELPRTGDFYTQDQVRAIVAYAAARAITVVPEIEMPGHALSAIRAYPELGSGVPATPGAESDWGVFPWLYNVDDSTFGFLEDVLTEVMALFPSAYIHVGGDEAVKDQWRQSPAIQARMRALGVANEAALQSWFIHRIETFLNAHGRRLIGWDEILEGGLAPNATVMSWRGIEGAVAAAKLGHDTVLSPAPILYLNHRQGTAATEPPGRGQLITLADVYGFDPAPASLTADQQHHILGVQGNLWTEHARTEARAAWMMFPRASAIAELGWSRAGASDFQGFVGRLLPQLDRLKPLGLEAATSALAPQAEMDVGEGGKARVRIANQIGSEIRYTLDGSAPGSASPLYAGPLDLTVPARLRAKAFRDGRALPGAIDRRIDAADLRSRTAADLHTCTDKLVLNLEDDAPAAGPRATFLTDILNPCWKYEAAAMDGVTRIALDVGQIPFNFQLGADRDTIRFARPATAEGEFEVRVDGCDGRRIATLPLAPAAGNPGLTTLRADLPAMAGRHDLCFTYTANGPDPMWGIAAVRLETAQPEAGR
ncbi:family 20 glycosylhydrolase [Sphingomonas fennica]|nr:family 20 glycosylhydrolase [Sphingomonas fennica]